MTPSFHNLYRRGRYAPRFEADSSEGQEQRERFAVALVGWALRHEAEFAAHFLQQICDVSEEKNPQAYVIEIEPKAWGDLVVSSKNGPEVFILEFKIGSDLAAHQNPFDGDTFWQPCVTNQARDGYGWQILESLKDQAKRPIFITVTPEAVRSETVHRGGLVCFAKSWSDLAIGWPNNSSRLQDLRTSLGQLGIVAFKQRHLLTMNTSEAAKTTAKLLEALFEAAEQGGFSGEIRGKKTLWYFDAHSDDDGWYCGIEFKSGSDRRLNKFLQPKDSGMLWMGYQSEIVAGQESVAAYVWFYCDLKAHERLSKAFAKYSSRKDGNNFGIIKDKISKDSAGDVSWFAQVIREARLLAVSSS